MRPLGPQQHRACEQVDDMNNIVAVVAAAAAVAAARLRTIDNSIHMDEVKVTPTWPKYTRNSGCELRMRPYVRARCWHTQPLPWASNHEQCNVQVE